MPVVQIGSVLTEKGGDAEMTEHKVPVQSLIDHIKTAIDVDPWAKKMVEELLKEQPEIVRCKECHYGEPVKNGAGDDCIQCNNDDLWWEGMLHFPDWFCADGERR